VIKLGIPRIGIFALLFVPALLAGCATTTTVKEAWKDPAFDLSGMKKVLVVGIAKENTVRTHFEDVCVQKWAEYGRTAFASHLQFPGATPPDQQTMMQYIQANGIDVVMVAQLKGRGMLMQPATTMVVSSTDQSWYGYYNTSYGTVTQPAQATGVEVAIIETKLFAVNTGTMVRSVVTDTVLGEVKDPIPGFVSAVLRQIMNME
jgi:hypothetical protein